MDVAEEVEAVVAVVVMIRKGEAGREAAAEQGQKRKAWVWVGSLAARGQGSRVTVGNVLERTSLRLGS